MPPGGGGRPGLAARGGLPPAGPSRLLTPLLVLLPAGPARGAGPRRLALLCCPAGLQISGEHLSSAWAGGRGGERAGAEGQGRRDDGGWGARWRSRES